MSNKIIRVDSEFDTYVRKMQVKLSKVVGKNLTIVQTSRIIATLNRGKPLKIIVKKKKRQKAYIDEMIPF